MKEWEMVAEAVVLGGAGMKANQDIQLPFSTGNKAVDLAIDMLIGLGVMYAGVKFNHKEIGVGMVAAGAGWTLNSGANAIGFTF